MSKKNQELLIKGTKNFFELMKPKMAEDGNNKLEQFINFTIEKMEEKINGTAAKKVGKKVDESSLIVQEESEKLEEERREHEQTALQIGKKRKANSDNHGKPSDAKRQEKSMKKRKLN